ncbi:MAG: hypothetical protein R6U13_00955 [Desulfatiglandaceae bacterium]
MKAQTVFLFAALFMVLAVAVALGSVYAEIPIILFSSHPEIGFF